MKKKAVKKEPIGPVQREINRRKNAIESTEAKIAKLGVAFDDQLRELKTTIASHRAVLKALLK